MIYKTVFFIYSAAVFSMKITFQRFRVAHADKNTVSFDVFNQKIDALKGFLILSLPVQVIRPSVIGPDFFTHRNPLLIHVQYLFRP